MGFKCITIRKERAMAKMKISRYLKREHVVFLKSNNKKLAIRELWDVIGSDRNVRDKNALLCKIWEREKIMSTAIGLGIGVPHVKMPSVIDFLIGIGISRQGIDYGALDRMPVHILVMVVSPGGKHAEYLKLLAGVVTVLKDPKVREAVIRAPDAESVFKIFRKK